MRKNRKFIIAGLVLVVAMGILFYTALGSAFDSYQTVSEFKSDIVYDEYVSIKGHVVEGSLEFNAEDESYLFEISDKDNQEDFIPVVHNGALPDSFEEGGGVTVKGELETTGVFHTEELLVECPSKYEQEKAQSGE
ncbi:MAG: cytochrome c maturation protein CcmE [Chloroflexota bacterium]|nr:cytochrome c maturation protein CcmE [Chloroflexota bacterium]